MLVAAKELGDPNFSRTVVYLLEHNADGAVGLITNRVIGEGNLNHLLKGFGLAPWDAEQNVDLHFGGLERGKEVQTQRATGIQAAPRWRCEREQRETQAECAGRQGQSLVDAFRVAGGPGVVDRRPRVRSGSCEIGTLRRHKDIPISSGIHAGVLTIDLGACDRSRHWSVVPGTARTAE